MTAWWVLLPVGIAVAGLGFYGFIVLLCWALPPEQARQRRAR